MMIRAPEVDELIISALDLIDVVGNVRGEVGKRAVALAEDTVLLVAVVGALKPERAVLLVQQPLAVHEREAVVDALFSFS